MKQKGMTDEEFIKKYEAFERKQQRACFCHKTFHDDASFATILHLIKRREQIRDVELKKLEGRLDKNPNNRDIVLEKLLVEIECFKDVLALHKLLHQDNDKPRHRREVKEAGSCKPKRS